jgi:hypothetical protein
MLSVAQLVIWSMIFLIKYDCIILYDSSLTLLTTAMFGSTGEDFGQGVALDSQRNFDVVGSTSGKTLGGKTNNGQPIL